ncbi:MAG TPA: PAC2 family protein, partial [Protaetiibacter sp.]|nr:PAC2 family protein [Protaetiibacter sp.]
IVFLGAMLADVPHTRPIAVFASSENASVRERFDLERSSYEGPVGIISVLGDAAERAGIPTVSIWASVPHYVHNAPSPKATLSLIEKLEDFIEARIDRGSLVEEAAAWERGIDELASDDDDMTAYIEQLEQARDTVDSPEASGDAIAEEFEKYLRKRDDDPPPAP